jgi:hypothetical protein
MIRLYDDRISIQAASMEGLEHHEQSGRGVILRQTMLEERGTIRLWSDLRALVASGDRLFAVTDGLVEAFDLSDPHMPMLTRTRQTEGVRGAVIFGGRLILWGEPGIWVAEDDPPVRRNEPFIRCDSNTVRGAAVARGRLFVLQGKELRVYNSQLCEEARYDSRGAEEVAAAGDFVVLRNSERLLVFDGRRGPEETQVHSHCHSGGVTKLESAALPFGGPAIYAYRAEGGALLRLRESGPPETMAEFASDAWFAGVVRAGRILAYVSDKGRMIRLLEPGRTEKSE